MSLRNWLGDPEQAPLHNDERCCVTCGRKLRSTDPGLLARFECADCQRPQEQGPSIAFVMWRGVRLGFYSFERALGFIEECRKANDPSVYCGPPVELPVLEVPESELVAVEE